LKDFIDLHTHGIGRYDTKTSNPEDILKIAELHGKRGAKAILPAIYPASIKEMRENMEAVRKAIKMQDSRYKIHPPQSPLNKGGIKGGYHESCIGYRASCILGVHLEGPFLNPLRCGALDKSSFIMPTISNLRRLVDGYEDIVKIITIASELTGAPKVIEYCVESGIMVNMGHSDATYKQAVDGKKAGATGITHMFNAMRPFHHREPGLIGLGLLDENLYIEVIADGVHLHPKTLELIFSKKRLDKIILVSDSVKRKEGFSGKTHLPQRGTKDNENVIPAEAGIQMQKRTGCPIKDPRLQISRAGFGHDKIEVFSELKGKPLYNKKGVLAGSGITIADSVRVLKRIGIPDAEIIEAAIDNPCRYLAL
jgi:N-acetylglucosamine-6-phosphate deacetylase